MSELGNQQAYWNYRIANRAANWDTIDVPLIPDQDDLDFQRRQLVSGGDTLILGATPQLTGLAHEVSGTVTSVDYGEKVIDTLRLDGVQYVCMDWIQFLDRSTDRFDNIMTDGGLICLEFPDSWEEIAEQIFTRLKPDGIFSARVYLSTDEPPKARYEDPNLDRFVPSMADIDDVHYKIRMQTPPYEGYDVSFTFPPRQKVVETFGRLALVEERIPDFVEGKRFPSFAWQSI